MDHIYVCHFSSGHIKVGHSRRPSQRIATHAERVRCVGVELIESKSFPCIGGGHQAERALIKWCADRASTSHFNEWFGGVDFGAACESASLIAALEFPVDGEIGDLDQAIAAAGGVSALARKLGIKNANIISMWRARGSVPYAWTLVIAQFLKRKTKPQKEVA